MTTKKVITKQKITSNWQLKTFGAPLLEKDGEIVKFARKKSLALLIYMVVRGRLCARETIANWFWPDLPEQDARTTLRTTLSDINRVLGKNWLQQSGEALELAKDFPLQVDFQMLSNAAKNMELVPISVLMTWQDGFLEGFHLDDCDVFEEWCYAQREAARNEFFQIMGHQLNVALTKSDWMLVSELAGLWLELDELCEAAHMALMRVHDHFGHTSQALLQYRKLEEKLRRELGVLPNSAAQLLKSEIEQGKSQAVTQVETVDWVKHSQITDIDYAKNGLVNIAFRQFGQGDKTLVIVSGFVSHLEQLLEEPFLRAFLGQLAERFKIIVFDKRGMGLSDRIGYPPSPQETADDVRLLLDQTGVKQAWVLGISEGGPAAIRCAYDNPDRIKAIMLFGTAAKWTASSDYPYSIESELYDKWLDSLEESWGTAANLEHFAPSQHQSEAMVKWWKKTLRLSSSPGAIRAVLDNARDIDVRDCLTAITQPALIVQQRGDSLVRVDNGRYLAEQLSNATYLELPGNDHWLWVCDTGPFFLKLDEFTKDVDLSLRRV